MSSKYSQKFLNHTKQATTDALETVSKRKKNSKGNCWFDCNQIADKTTKISKSSQQTNSERVRNEHYKEIPKEKYISPEERQKIIDDLRLM